MLPIQMLQSPSPGPATILLRNRALGGMHLGINPQGERRRPPHAP
jgi:hypothetical protein